MTEKQVLAAIGTACLLMNGEPIAEAGRLSLYAVTGFKWTTRTTPPRMSVTVHTPGPLVSDPRRPLFKDFCVGLVAMIGGTVTFGEEHESKVTVEVVPNG